VRVLGIDPGSRHTGFAVVEGRGTRLTLLSCGTISPGDELPLHLRLRAIHAGLREVVERLDPVAVAVEEVYHARNARSALVLGHARGAALLAASALEVHEYAASEIKKSVTGTGRAEKLQVARMVELLLGVKAPGDEHACDAIATAICHLNRAFRPPAGLSVSRGRG
jgi:crossover junction endodeoxyribonuclease RuvC